MEEGSDKSAPSRQPVSDHEGIGSPLGNASSLDSIGRVDEAKLRLAEREVAVKEGELALKRLDHASSTWRSPLVVEILGATIAALSNAGVTLFNAESSRAVAYQSAENAGILEMIKAGDAIQIQRNFEFLIRTGLVSDDMLIESIKDYYELLVPSEGPGTNSEARLTPEYLSSFDDFMNAFNLSDFNVVEYLSPGAASQDPINSLFETNTPLPRGLWENVAKIALVIEEFTRRHGAPMTITSSYRNSTYNAGERLRNLPFSA